MITTRAQLIKAGRAAVITSLDQTVLEAGQRIYWLKWNGDTLSLMKTGLYVRMGNRGSERSVANSVKKDQTTLIFVHWDGTQTTDDPSRHTIDRLGLTLELDTDVIVTSLDGIEWQEGRPLSVRNLHTPPS